MASPENLSSCLTQQADLLSEFIGLLAKENQALLDDPSNQDLVAITTNKNDFAQRIAKLDEKRVQLLNELGYSDDKDGIAALTNKFPILKNQFEALWNLADKADKINNENGQLLATFIEHNQRAIDTLRALMGQDVYDSKGKFKKTGL